jgi:uncharacterized protein (TIGR03382 family)
MRFVVVTLVIVVAVGRPSAVDACSLLNPQPFEIDPAMQATDHQPPVLTGLAVTDIKRGRGPESTGCGSSGSSCDDLGWIGINPAVTDDHTPAEKLGFLVSVVGGKLPQGLDVPAEPLRLPLPGQQIVLSWLDGASDDQEPFDFTLSVVALDLAGNESAPVEVHVSNDGGGGCNIAWFRNPTAPALAFALLALAALTRRRSRSGPPVKRVERRPALLVGAHRGRFGTLSGFRVK